MKLQQGQIWHKGDHYYRIVQWARLNIEYKLITDLETREGTFHEVTKKEFCRLIKGAVLLEPDTPSETDAPEKTKTPDETPSPDEADIPDDQEPS